MGEVVRRLATFDNSRISSIDLTEASVPESDTVVQEFVPIDNNNNKIVIDDKTMHISFYNEKKDPYRVSNLPYDILVYIFLFLPQKIEVVRTLSSVCTSWRDASSSNLLWKAVYKNLNARDVICEVSRKKNCRKRNSDQRAALPQKIPSLSFRKHVRVSSDNKLEVQGKENSNYPMVFLRLLEDERFSFNDLKEMVLLSQLEEEGMTKDSKDEFIQNKNEFYHKCSVRLFNYIQEMDEHRMRYVNLMKNRNFLWCVSTLAITALFCLFVILFSISTSNYTAVSIRLLLNIVNNQKGWTVWNIWWILVFSPIFAIPFLFIFLNLRSLGLVIQQRLSTKRFMKSYFASIAHVEAIPQGIMSETRVERLTNMTSPQNVFEHAAYSIYFTISSLLVLSSLVMISINSSSHYFKNIVLDRSEKYRIWIDGWIVILPIVIWIVLTWFCAQIFIIYEILGAYLARRFRFHFDTSTFAGKLFKYSDDKACSYFLILEFSSFFITLVVVSVLAMVALDLYRIVTGWILILLPLCLLEIIALAFSIMLAVATVFSQCAHKDKIPAKLFLPRCLAASCILMLLFSSHIMLMVGVDPLYILIPFLPAVILSGIWICMEIIQYHSYLTSNHYIQVE
jgi:hypothetical protein